MDAIQLVKKQKIHDATVEEVTNARTAAAGKTYPNLKARLDDITDNIRNQDLYWKDAVPNKAGLGVYTPNAKDGWCATVLDENAIYRYEEGTQTWIKISSVYELATPNKDGLMSSVDKDKLDNLDQNYVGKNGDSTINGALTVTGGVNGNASSASRLENLVDITIGNTTKQFDGSQPLEWTIDEIANFNLEMDVREYTVNQPMVNEIPIGTNVEIDDIVIVYMGGLRLHPGKHYNLTTGAAAKITPGQGVEFLQNDHFTFEVLRFKAN